MAAFFDPRTGRRVPVDEDLLLSILEDGTCSDLEVDDGDEEFVPAPDVYNVLDEEFGLPKASPPPTSATNTVDFKEDAGPSRKRKKQVKIKIPQRKRIWKKTEFIDRSHDSYSGHPAPIAVRSPIEYFNDYYLDAFFEKMSVCTNMYYMRKTGGILNSSKPEIKRLYGIHLMMGILNYPRIPMYWRQKIKIDAIASVMTRDRFMTLRNNLHVVESDAPPAGIRNPLWKVQPVLDAVKDGCNKILRTPGRFSVDEQMNPFTGKCHLRQLVKNKPRPVGLKNFVITTSEGLMVDFEIYYGNNPALFHPLGLGPAVVLRLIHSVPSGSCLFFDRYFTTIPLLEELKRLGYHGTGTIMANRIPECKQLNFKEDRKMKRGDIDQRVSNDIVLVKWRDSKAVLTASNCTGGESIDIVKRYNKNEKCYVDVDAPKIVTSYNAFMGGVDVLDQSMEYYRTFMKTRKWTLKVILHFMDLAVVNAWRLYRCDSLAKGIPKNRIEDLLAFRFEIAETLLNTPCKDRIESAPLIELEVNLASRYKPANDPSVGSTTDLTPTLIGIYDSLLEPEKSLRPETCRLETAKDARNDPPVKPTKESQELNISKVEEAPTMMTGGVKPISNYNKSSLYGVRTKSEKESVSDEVDKCNISDASINKIQRTFKETKQASETTFDNLSPNVKRMISSSEMTTLKFPKKTVNIGRTSMRKSNIPLVGATSKISQSGVEILPSVEIYDQPCVAKNLNKSITEENEPPKVPLKPEFKIDDTQTYDVPTNNRPAIYDVPVNNKTAFESLSLPYIDQSIELSITSNDREFDIKLSSKEVSPLKLKAEETPVKISTEGTNSLHRKDFSAKTESPTKLFSKAVPYPETVGSTGNLKPEKDTIRLNPPVVEVSRPLSMSSIASSSSTSSSGVQNKGGVNSAYLASIESLDDHSDVDMTSANGSNNFVNDAGMMTASGSGEGNSVASTAQLLDEMPGLTQLERVCAEIIQTENVYVEDLRQVVEGYLHVWRREMTFSDEQLSELFNNIEDIYAFNRSLCAELNTCRLDAKSIARCFVRETGRVVHKSGFSVYTSYCTGYPRTMERLAALASDPRSAREFRERQTELGHLLPLASYLLKPVQRILKYHLLLQNVVKQCASRETEYALLKMTGIAQHIDDMKRRHEHAVRVQEIQSLLYGWNGPDLTTYGELCAEGTFRVFGAKAMRHAFLFDKMLLVTKNREDGILAYKSHIMCNNMMLVESIAGAPLSFHVIPWDAPRAQLTLQARSQRHKREWTLLLKRVILENYNAVIPSHARQLVMELGQNKTDDDMLAEKSHNLITQASMRKQLSAPEYLEKRKLDRDRRKSFESGIRGRLKKANRKYTVPSSRAESQECDCSQVSAEKGTDYTCENCYIDLCSDCEAEAGKVKKEDKCSCRHDDSELGEKCPECDRSLHYIDSGSAEHLERKQSGCKCSDFKSSQESFSKEFGCPLSKTRGYHSSDNIIGYTDNKSKDDLSDNNSLSSIKHINRTCLKCSKIKENIVVTDTSSTLHTRRSRCNDTEKQRVDNFRSKSRDDPQRSRLSKIGTWRRKSEPGLQQNMIGIITKKSQDSDSEKSEIRGNEKIEFECKNCGSNKVSRKTRTSDGSIISDLEGGKRSVGIPKPSVEIRMYNTKNIPKKISKIKKNRAKGLRLGADTTAKFYADFSTDVSTENILHISESNDSLNIDKPKETQNPVPDNISKDEDIDEETYKKLIEKTDSFKKNELEKVKYLNKQKVINEASEVEDKASETDVKPGEVVESCEETEQPLEQIISQLLMQNREFQKLVKKQQQRNSTQRRHQRLLKSHSSPEPSTIAKNLEMNKLKVKYGHQLSEDLDIDKNEEEDNTATSSRTDVNEELVEDHIYETLRIDTRVDESLHSLDAKSKVIQHVNRQKRLPSPPNIGSNDNEINKHIGPDSDYVYLTFDKLNRLQDTEGIYDVPVKSPEKVSNRVSSEYYVTMEHKGPAINEMINENVYDTLVEVCRRKKDVPNDLPSDYLPMSPDQQSPNTPEIWLSRQKEHFNVSRDRKSGSLPRSFQVITSNPEENLSTFKCKPNSNSKTYLNRDGKVMSTDRPFTIASDQSEINYDDMSEGEILKFNKSKTNEVDYVENISQSTLELEEEIDRCYKSNFEKIDLDNNKNENLTVSQPNLDVSTTSSCEVLPLARNDDTKSNDIEIIHPEHRIYKPTSNMLSLKNVLSRFKTKSPNKNSDDGEINANDQSSPDSVKSDIKSPEKRSALNPRSYSKNLLQRFRNIIGDEHTDDNRNKSETIAKTPAGEYLQNELKKTDIVITTTDSCTTTSNVAYSMNNDMLSKSVCEHTTMSESQTEKNNLETLSQSCDNLDQKTEIHHLSCDREGMVNNISNLTGSPVKSNNTSYQSLNKLPIYMQGSKYLGARIAQSDYVDPTTLTYDKTTTLKKVNILINKSSIRPDSLFSNSSFVTSSSEGTYQEPQNKINYNQNSTAENIVGPNLQNNADESYYEKSFESIEQVTDDDVFRDSAVYSDQEDNEDVKDTVIKNQVINVTRVESVKTKTMLKDNDKINIHTRVIVTSNKTANVERVNSIKKSANIRPKVAPPVPAKPKLTRIPSVTNSQIKTVTRTLSKSSEQSSSSESVNMKTIKRNVNYKQSLIRSESSKHNEKPKTQDNIIKDGVTSSETKTVERDKPDDKSKPQGNIQMKRLSFERASLDSVTRKLKSTAEEQKLILEKPKSSKSVLERRMEIERMSKIQSKHNLTVKKPVQTTKPKSITTKVANFERSISDIGVIEISSNSSTEKNIPDRNSIEQKSDNESDKNSWVKQVVNKFQ